MGSSGHPFETIVQGSRTHFTFNDLFVLGESPYARQNIVSLRAQHFFLCTLSHRHLLTRLPRNGSASEGATIPALQQADDVPKLPNVFLWSTKNKTLRKGHNIGSMDIFSVN